MKLSFHTSQQISPGSTSLQLAIAYTDGVLNEDQVSSAIQLGIDAIQHSLSHSVVCNSSRRRAQQERYIDQGTQGDSLDEILEQILRQGAHSSAV